MSEIIITAITVIGKILIALFIVSMIMSIVFITICLCVLQKGTDSLMYIDLDDDKEQMEALRLQQEKIQKRKEAIENARKIRTDKQIRAHKVIDAEEENDTNAGDGLSSEEHQG